MSIRIYLSPRSAWGNRGTRMYNLISDLAPTAYYDEYANLPRNLGLCLVDASDADHATILADTRVLPLSNLVSDRPNLESHLDAPLSSLPGVDSVKTELEDRGVSMSWVTGSNSLRDAIRYLIRNFTISQYVVGDNNASMRDLITRNLDITVGQVPAGIRNDVRNWMQARGLAIGWINNSTTVREILHFIVTNLGMGEVKITGVAF